jgi:hypothetical protein
VETKVVLILFYGVMLVSCGGQYDQFTKSVKISFRIARVEGKNVVMRSNETAKHRIESNRCLYDCACTIL